MVVPELEMNLSPASDWRMYELAASELCSLSSISSASAPEPVSLVSARSRAGNGAAALSGASSSRVR